MLSTSPRHEYLHLFICITYSLTDLLLFPLLLYHCPVIWKYEIVFHCIRIVGNSPWKPEETIFWFLPFMKPEVRKREQEGPRHLRFQPWLKHMTNGDQPRRLVSYVVQDLVLFTMGN